MAASVADRLKHVHPQMLRVGTDPDRKKFAELRPVIGRLVERALEIAGLSKQEAAFAMGYADSGVISRWCSGAERPLFDKLFAIDRFEDAWLVALAERNPRAQVVTQVLLQRSA